MYVKKYIQTMIYPRKSFSGGLSLHFIPSKYHKFTLKTTLAQRLAIWDTSFETRVFESDCALHILVYFLD